MEFHMANSGPSAIDPALSAALADPQLPDGAYPFH